MNELTETQKAYLAGFFDGEGCISITTTKDKKARTPNYQLVAILAQKNFETLRDLYEMVSLGKLYDQTNGRSRICVWRMSQLQAREFLATILPYLRNKKKEAELAIEFVEKFNRSARNKSKEEYFSATPQLIVDEKERYRVELHRLKGISGSERGRPRKLLV